MGCVSSVDSSQGPDLLSKPTLTVATLNYSGIMNSPFQFYCEQYENQLKQISTIFLGLLPKYFPNFSKDKFKWEMGKIDLKVRVGRYSPMFSGEVGIEKGKFISRKQFQAKWEEVFQVQSKKVKFQFTNSEKQVTKLYDLIMFHTLLRYVYKLDTLEQALDKNPETYIKTLRPLYQLSFLNQQRKIKKMVSNFAKLQCDVFFFQEYSDYFYNYLVNRKQHVIAVDSDKDTMIIAKEASFTQKKDIDFVLRNLSQQQKDNLNSSTTNAFLCMDNYIFISAHLSSKAQKNKPQIQRLKTGLIDLRKLLPDYDVIFGGDLNSFMAPFTKQLYFYPQSEKILTTVKKRTMSQGQFHKAEKVVQQSKDKIISSLKFQYFNTIYISGRVPTKDNYVPTNEHPFDHFVLVAKVHKRNTK